MRRFHLFKNILVPLDESELSERALAVARDLSRLHGATIHLLEAVQPHAEVYSGPDSAVASQYEVQAMRNSAEIQINNAQRYLARIVRDCKAEGLDTRSEVREAAPAQSIESYATDNGIDLIVMSTHGRGGIPRMLIGSVTDRVVRSVDVPVLVIPRGMS